MWMRTGCPDRALIRIRDLQHYFGEGEAAQAGSVRQQPGRLRGRDRDHDRPLRVGQNDAADADRHAAHRAGGQPARAGPGTDGASREELVATRREIGFIFQAHNLFGSLTAMQNVRMGLELFHFSQAEMKQSGRRRC